MQLGQGWHSRGYLPHFDNPRALQAITFRLADSLPAHASFRIPQHLSQAEKQQRLAHVERCLDRGQGRCELRDPRCADIVERHLLYHDGVRYRLVAWVVMSNHVHVLFETFQDWPMSGCVKSWKGLSSHGINKLLGRSGRFWWPDYFDRYIRDAQHFDSALQYIEHNPVKAGIVQRAEDFRFSSAWWRAQQGMRTQVSAVR